MKYTKWDKGILDKAKSLKKRGLNYSKIAEKLNKEFDISVSASSVNHALLDYQRGKYHFSNAQQNSKELKRKIRINEDGNEESTTLIKMTEEQAKSKEFVLRAHGFNSSEWSIVNVVNNLWQQHSIQDGTVDLYQSKIIVKPKTGLTLEEQLAFLTENVKPVQLPTVKGNLSARNLVIPLADLHFGVTSFEDIKEKLKEILSNVRKGFDQIVIVQLSDLLHSDQINKTQTVKATQLNDVDMPKAIHDAEKFMFTLIETAYQNCNRLSVKYVGGNHDFDLGYMFEEMLKIKYPQVDIDVNNGYRNAFTVGKSVGLLIGHGDMGKNKLPMLFATEYPDIWSHSTYREILTGHYHKEQVEDDFGVVLHQLGTPKKTDHYEYANGYTMANKKMQLFEYNDYTLKNIYYI